MAQFRARLLELNLERQVYNAWLQALLEDWHSTTVDRSGTADQRTALQAVWYMWQDLGLLSANSPLPLQKDLQEHWTTKAVEEWQSCLSNSTAPAERFLEWIGAVHAHVTVWRPWLPVPWLWHLLDVHAVQPHLQALLQPDHLHPLLHAALLQDNRRPVQQLWMLAGRLPSGQQEVSMAIGGFCKTEGLQRLQNTAASSKPAAATTTTTAAVSELLKLQESVTSMIQSLPGGADLISLKTVWEEVVNADGSLAESLAKFLDLILRSNKKLDWYASRHPDDAWLQRIIGGIFVPLQAKDVFEAFYKRDLAKRLLWNRVVSMDVEKQVCSLLKAECGAGYTSKMEGMFQDIDLSRESMMVYKQSLAAEVDNNGGGVEMEVQILTTGYWPVYPQYPNLHLPENLLRRQEHFDAHYKKKCHGRRITWQYALGHCIVRTSGFPKAYELVVSLCQALVLLQFVSTETRWTLPALMQAVGLDDRDEMERILQSLALGKEGTRILRKLEFGDAAKKKKTVDDRDEFEINAQFTSNQRRIRIQNILMKETKEERDKTHEAVSRDRLYLMDAVLVRIMKARKTLLHQQLLAQVLDQCKFPAKSADVKKRIESLIEREYMERDAKDRNRYNYLA